MLRGERLQGVVGVATEVGIGGRALAQRGTRRVRALIAIDSSRRSECGERVAGLRDGEMAVVLVLEQVWNERDE